MEQADLELIDNNLDEISERMEKIRDFSKTIEDAVSHCVNECKDNDHVLPVIGVLNKEINNAISEIDDLSDKVFKIKYKNSLN